jgi:hypothetical protein
MLHTLRLLRGLALEAFDLLGDIYEEVILGEPHINFNYLPLWILFGCLAVPLSIPSFVLVVFLRGGRSIIANIVSAKWPAIPKNPKQ